MRLEFIYTMTVSPSSAVLSQLQIFQLSALIILPSFPCSRYCFQKMAATKQESKSITLKGSAELVTEFFGNFCLHVDFSIRLVLF